MGPTFEALLNLQYSLGITPRSSDTYFYEDSNIPVNIRPLLTHRNSLSLVNIFLIVIFGPIISGIVIKILSATKYSDNRLVDRAWRYAFASFFFYGLIFLAYVELASLSLNLRYF